MTGTIWDKVLARIETKVNRYSYFTWFKNTALLRDEGAVLAVRVTDPTVVDWLTKHYGAVVAEAPSRSYNPLFIYGGVGLGKTHLMHAIGQYVLTHNAGLKLTYISAERFMNEVVNAIRYDRILEFRERYRSVDVLLVDDIQF